jgi:cation:H+ antiporter
VSFGILVGLSFLVLLIGIDRLILGVGGVTRKLGVPPFLVGLTVAGSVTSIPEIFLALSASIHEATALTLNTIVGSNSANIGLVLGISLLLVKVTALSEHLFRTALLMVAMTAVALGLLLDTYLSRIDGLVLITGYFIGIIWALGLERLDGPIYSKYDSAYGVNISTVSCVSYAAVGVAMVAPALFAIYLGLDWFGYPSDERFGILFASVVTSLPELYVCLVSTLRREYEFAFGTVIGSNLINLSLGLGIAAVVQPSKVSSVLLSLHAFVMVAFSMLFIAVILEHNPAKQQHRRLEGAALIIAYLAYLAYVVARGR